MMKPMISQARLAALALTLILAGCGSDKPKPDDIAALADVPTPQLYQTGVGELQQQHYDKAVKDFDALEQNDPYSPLASHAQLLAGYAQYKQQNYDDSISALGRYIALHPQSQDTAYAYYLKALCYYEQIEDEQRDQTTTYEAIQTLTDVITRFPDSGYARDARIKLRLAQNRLAGHEMVIGRYYESQHLYAGAIGRFQNVIDNFQTTTYTPEALERLVECDLDIGLVDAAVHAAAVLGYNYPGSTWYQAAYGKLKAHHLLTAKTVKPTGNS